MKILILTLALISGSAFAAGDVQLSKECKAQLKKDILAKEAAFLAAAGETLAGPLTADVGVNYWPKRQDASVFVRVEEEVDGRTVSYGAKALKTDIRACKNINLVRRTELACRYSRFEGPDSLTEIKGITFKSGRTIKPNSRLNKVEEQQIQTWLDSEKTGASLAELIKSTDEGELSSATVTLPDGKVLDYYGAYGGDNPYGIFYVEGTMEVAGDNGDGSICIKYLK